jgi:transcriptional regulator with XRE-family HTH domain
MGDASAATGFAGALIGWRRRRRVSQLELALRAGTTQRQISFLENGRSRAGRAMVVRLAEALELPLRQRNALLLLAGYAPAYEETGFSDAKLAPVRTAVERILAGHDPYPAVVVDRFSELIAANAAFWTLVDGAAPELLQAPVNVARLLLDPGGLGDRIVNFCTWAWHVVDAVQHEAAQTPTRASRRCSPSWRPWPASARRQVPTTWGSPSRCGCAHRRASFSS